MEAFHLLAESSVSWTNEQLRWGMFLIFGGMFLIWAVLANDRRK